jgi:DNA polymerase (family 10)
VPERPFRQSSNREPPAPPPKNATAEPPPATAEPPSTAEPPLPSNAEIARILHEIGDILEVKGEVVYKTVAYHRAADEIARQPIEVARAYREGRPPHIPGIGKAIAEKLEELARTGRLDYYERLRAEFPASLLALLEIPGVGPKTVKLVYEQLGIDSIEDLRRAAERGLLRRLRGFSAKAEQSILAGIAALERRPGRMLLDRAAAYVERLEAALRDVPGLRRLVAAGSFRRRVETIGDLDLLAETAEPGALVERLTSLPEVERVLGAGPHKASVVLRDGPQVDCMIMPPGAAGTYLVHFTGSKAHNVRLRAMARDRGWSLSEHGFARLGPDGEPATGHEAELRTFATEAEVYAFLDLPYIEPELREDRGEIEAALAGRLPRLVERSDLRGDLHCHSDWSDGVHDVATMAEAARRAGLEYAVLTDHTVSLAIARGLDPARFAAQRAVVAELNARFEAEEREGRLPPGASPAGFRLLHGCELEIRADGSLDLPDEVLAGFDVVVASLHVGRRQPRERLTARVLAAIRSPHVDVIAHPAGRIIGERDDLDLDWEAIFEAAAATGTALELNGSPPRLDLSAERARRAVEAGCLLAIDSDAHRTTEFGHLDWGVSQARRGWVEARSVVNTWPRAELLAWAAGKGDRVG